MHIVDINRSKWYKVLHGGMAEWFKAAVLKTVVRKYRGFESYFLRQKFTIAWRGDREADGARLLSECGGKTPPRVRIPPSPPVQRLNTSKEVYKTRFRYRRAGFLLSRGVQPFLLVQVDVILPSLLDT